MIVYVLKESGGEYEDQWEDVCGVTASPERAVEWTASGDPENAWNNYGGDRPGHREAIEQEIDVFKNKVVNPPAFWGATS